MDKPVALGADHAGFALKEAVRAYLEARGVACRDFGTFSEASCDYPDMAAAPCAAVTAGEGACALLFCGTGGGIWIAANKIRGIRACWCWAVFSARYSRRHNDANALCMGGRVLGEGLACALADAFLEEKFEGGRHTRRVEKLRALDQ